MALGLYDTLNTLFFFQISTENIQSLNLKNLTINLSKTSVLILKIPTEHSDITYQDFTMNSSNFPIEHSENADFGNSSMENEQKLNCINIIDSDDDNDCLITIKNNNINQNNMDIKEKTVINKIKRNYKKKNKRIHFIKPNNCKTSRDDSIPDRSVISENDTLGNNTNDQLIKSNNIDNGNTSDLHYDIASNNDVLDNSIFIKENELHKDVEDKFVYNNSNMKKGIIKKEVKKQRHSKKKTEDVNIEEEDLNNESSETELGADVDNSKCNIQIVNKRNTKEVKSLKTVDSKSILPEFISLFAKPKNDSFFSKDNMDKFSKGAYFYMEFLCLKLLLDAERKSLK